MTLPASKRNKCGDRGSHLTADNGKHECHRLRTRSQPLLDGACRSQKTLIYACKTANDALSQRYSFTESNIDFVIESLRILRLGNLGSAVAAYCVVVPSLFKKRLKRHTLD